MKRDKSTRDYKKKQFKKRSLFSREYLKGQRQRYNVLAKRIDAKVISTDQAINKTIETINTDILRTITKNI